MQEIMHIKNSINKEASRLIKLGPVKMLNIAIDVTGDFETAINFLTSPHGGFTEYEIKRALYLKKWNKNYYKKIKAAKNRKRSFITSS